MRDLIELVPVLRKAYGKGLSFLYLILLTVLLSRLHVMIIIIAGLK